MDVKQRKKLVKNKVKKTYNRQELHKMKKLGDRWKKPRGTDSNKRRKMKKKGAVPEAGHRTARNIRFAHPSGFFEIVVANVKELEAVGKDYAVRIKGTVGKKKKIEISNAASKQGLKILNKVSK
ncbi:MAG: 50S ribosomal protein L32e [Candidatus Diapherotrites archaeon]|nr:50S ribosomal protein L32e [Candidatus Diapherotrites archaeon]